MPPTPLPDIDLARARRWCAAAVPAHVLHQVRVEPHVHGRHVTLCETRVPFDGVGEWTHFPFARLRYRVAARDWALYWRDRNERWHEYAQGNRQFGTMEELLAEVDADPTHIFRG
jgi:hypothetical protein